MNSGRTRQLPPGGDGALARRERAEIERQSFSELIAGVADDARTMIARELEVARIDIRRELADARTVAISAGVGLTCVGVAVLILAMAAGFLLARTAIVLWLSYAIIGGALLLLGGGALFVGMRRVGRLRGGPQAAREIRRDVAWIKESLSDRRSSTAAR